MLSYPDFREDFLNYRQCQDDKPDEMIIVDAYFDYRKSLDEVDIISDKKSRRREFATGAFLFILAFLLDKLFKL